MTSDTEHTHEYELVGHEISKDEKEIKEWRQCQICGRGRYDFKPNKWKGTDLELLCPKCGKHLVMFEKYQKLDRKAKDRWNPVSPEKKIFVGCSGYPDCDYNEHNRK